MRKLFLFLIPFFLFSFSLLGQTPPNYYVSSTSGNDITGDGTLANPWQTIEYAFSNIPAVTSENITLHVQAGTYTIANTLEIDAARGGNGGFYFIIRNYLNDNVIINGANIGVGAAMVLINSANYVKVQGLKLTNLIGNDKRGIFIQGNSNNIEISGNELSEMHWMENAPAPGVNDNVHPLYVIGTVTGNPITDVIIENNQIHDITPGYSEGLTVTGNVDGFTLEGNTLYHIKNIAIVAAGNYEWVETNHGITPAENQARNGTIKNNEAYLCEPACIGCDAPAAIYLDGSKNITVENNISRDNTGFGFSIGCEQEGSSTGHIIRNNIAYNNSEYGIIIGSHSVNNNVQNITVSGNTFYKNYTLNDIGGELHFQIARDVSIENNIMFGDQTVLSRVSPICNSLNCTNINLNYNLYYNGAGDPDMAVFEWFGNPNNSTYGTFSAYQTGSGQDQSPNSSFQNPLFVDETLPNPDLHLNSGSPAIDSGDPAYVMSQGEVDMDMESRIYNNIRIDQGADESDVSPLPVEYSRPLQGVASSRGIRLEWSTASEVNTSYFQLQRSSDSRTWDAIRGIPASGSANDYSVLDHFPVTGNNYYRLKQLDADGQFEYSSFVIVEWKNEKDRPSLYPNPANGAIFIHSGSTGILGIKVFTTLGQEVRHYPGQVSKIDDLPVGLYYCVFFTTKETIPVLFKIE